jgi:ribosomal-protein-alanine N-acetyltransferase
MIGFITRLFRRGEPALSEARVADAAAIAALHAQSFHRGWSEGEIESLLIDRGVFAHRATLGRSLKGFIVSRLVKGEAEILSVAIAAASRGRGLAARLLDLHLRELERFGTRTVFLEVDEDNAPARRLYARVGFREVGRRAAYYQERPGKSTAALVLRRDF